MAQASRNRWTSGQRIGALAGIALSACGLLSAPAMAGDGGKRQQVPAPDPRRSWTADNGNGTYTNPLFNEEFSDPDIIRVAGDYFMTGTTMQVMPGLPVLHSKDLVNWTLLGYVFDRLDMGPEYRFEGGKDAYGNGIWAPALRYHNGNFYIFANINEHGTQVFRARDPKGPWLRTSLGATLHDLSVLFDDDGRVYAVYGYGNVHLVELKPDLSGIVAGTDKVIIHEGGAVGEGHHFYRINGKYLIVSADYAPVGRMTASRADRVDGPYETVVISARETMGRQQGWVAPTVRGRPVPAPGEKIELGEPRPNTFGAVPLHQGGIVDLPNGDWWGWSMMDTKSMGRTTFLSPVTWEDGWPYFGLPGNLGRSPVTWLKPATGALTRPEPTYQHNDDFSGLRLQPVWQWNHVPVDNKWSLRERPGMLRLHSLAAPHFLLARNTLTQRAVGPESVATTTLDAHGLKAGDVAGLGLLNIPYYWLGVSHDGNGYRLRFYDELADRSIEADLPGPMVKLRVAGDFDREFARFSYSIDGKAFVPIGGEVRLAYQLKTFQGVRYALFAFNDRLPEGGVADFDDFTLDEPLADRSRDIPLGRIVTIRNLANGVAAWANPHGVLDGERKGVRIDPGALRFRVLDRGSGRVALEAMDGSGFLTVVGRGLPSDVRLMKAESAGSLFQWQDMLRRQFMLLSLRTNRYLGIDPETGEPYAADWPGPRPDRKDGTVLEWDDAVTSGAPQ
jgi:beta-xylosidase